MSRKNAIWQIWIPLILVLILVGILAYFLFASTAGGEGNELTQWADISLIYLLAPVIALSAIIPVLFIACISFMNLSHTKIHDWLGIAQVYSSQISQKTQQVSKKTLTIFSGPSAWLKKQEKAEDDGREK